MKRKEEEMEIGTGWTVVGEWEETRSRGRRGVARRRVGDPKLQTRTNRNKEATDDIITPM